MDEPDTLVSANPLIKRYGVASPWLHARQRHHELPAEEAVTGALVWNRIHDAISQAEIEARPAKMSAA